MQGQTVIVVGGASGLGLTTARPMVERGSARIGLIDRNEQLLASSSETLRSMGAEVAVAVADISRSETAHRGFKEIADQLGRIHSLVNSAAIYPRRPILEITDEEWDLENAINVKGTYH